MPAVKGRPFITSRAASARYKATLALAERFPPAAAAHGRHEGDWLDRLFRDPANDDGRRPGRSRVHVREDG